QASGMSSSFRGQFSTRQSNDGLRQAGRKTCVGLFGSDLQRFKQTLITRGIRGSEIDAAGIVPMEPEILVVEDDPETLDLITIILERHGYRVVVAHDGRAGLEVVACRNPPLIITDVRMPQIDGIAMIKQIRAMGVARRFTPILAVTAYQYEHAADAMEAGASRVLGKP